MNNGIYGAVSGSLAAVNKLDVLANNLANVNTPGYKKDRIRFESVLAASGAPGRGDGAREAPVLVEERYAIDFSVGDIRYTGNTFDLALDGEGFFVVNTPEGKAYTRQGNFRVDANGKLVTADGYEVLGEGLPSSSGGGPSPSMPRERCSWKGSSPVSSTWSTFPGPMTCARRGARCSCPASPTR